MSFNYWRWFTGPRDLPLPLCLCSAPSISASCCTLAHPIPYRHCPATMECAALLLFSVVVARAHECWIACCLCLVVFLCFCVHGNIRSICIWMYACVNYSYSTMYMTPPNAQSSCWVTAQRRKLSAACVSTAPSSPILQPALRTRLRLCATAS